MCDYSLESLKSRPAKVGDRLRTTDWGTGTIGFGAPLNDGSGMDGAVCVLPGTELAFDDPVALAKSEVVNGIAFAGFKQTQYKTAIFRQINKEIKHTHHDIIEFPDGRQSLLNHLQINQYATVLQLPAEPKTVEEAKEQERVAWAG